ncbi:hypothetical protein H2248_008571 [Termitomyces sp. 'cryptogamus']|nr:hypothetical protein H2248_008571 [Termitomyces sp. 'cryptogamus']
MPIDWIDTDNIEEGNSPSLIEQLEENHADSSSITADIAEEEYDDLTERPSPVPSDCYSEDGESYIDSPHNVCLDLELNLNVEEPVNHDPVEEYFDKVLLTIEQDFGCNSYEFVVSNIEERMELVWKEEMACECPNQIGCVAAQKLDFLLEHLQPYPGDPSNVLQLKGQQFLSGSADYGGSATLGKPLLGGHNVLHL